MNFSIRMLLTVCFLAATLVGPLMADTPSVRQLTVNGTSIIHVVPDEMEWNVQVTINDATLAKAKERHDASLAGALAYLKGLGVAVKDLQTGGIRFDKNMYPGDDAAARKNPFSCSTQVTFTLTDFEKYGAICDALVKLDGVLIQSVDYGYAKEAEVRRDALQRALLDAHDKAVDLAATANCSINAPLSITEQNGGYVRPDFRNATFSARAPSQTPGAVAGQIEFNASVVVTYDLTPK